MLWYTIAEADTRYFGLRWERMHQKRVRRTWVRVSVLSVAIFFGSCDSATAPDDRPPQQDPNRLLTDEELRTPEDPGAPAASPEFVAWLDDHHAPIRSLVSDDYSDLRMLEPLLQGKRVVQLGESGHGVREYNQAKVRLVRYLHEELGYNVLAFESPTYECFKGDGAEDPSGMFACPFRIWHTEELARLFGAMTDERERGDDGLLRLAGFDMQIVAGGRRPQELAELAGAAAGDEYARAVFAMDSSLLANYEQASLADWLPERADSLVAGYTALADTLSAHRATLEAAFPDSPDWPAIAVVTARSMGAYIRFYLTAPGNLSRTVLRDSVMALNLKSLLEIYEDEKFIIWGHNFHLRYDNESIPQYRIPTMGQWLSDGMRDEMYTIGFYMYRGTAAYNNRQTYELQRPVRDGLENIAYHVRKKHFFFDLTRAEQSPATRWLFEPIVTKTWGLDDITMVLHDQYDGIIFIDAVSPPDYLPFQF